MPFNEIGLNFMAENRLRNSREWYQEHKELYQKNVLAPMQELVEALTPAMLAIDPAFITAPKIGKTISHLNRDTRFTKDKSLYRENIWCTFMREKKLYDGLPAFYVDVSPQGYSYGCGYYKASGESMELLRRMILADDPLWLAAKACYEGQHTFTLYGERYKRPRCPEAPAEKQSWLDLKNFGFSAEGQDQAVLLSGELAAQAAREFTRIAPLYAFMIRAEELRAGEEKARRAAQRGRRPADGWGE